MADASNADDSTPPERGPAADGGPGGTPRLRLVGPGIVVAATGVGAGDLVATLIAGSRFGTTLLWAAVLGCLVKISLAEAAGRWHLATGRTLFAGWASLGRWTTWYFVGYVVVWGFVYGATAMTSSALPLAALFPAVDLKLWAVAAGVVGLAFVWFNRYAVFERAMTVLVGVMFVVVVLLAALTVPNVPRTLAGLVPVLPDGSLVYTLGLVGGVGGTITVAAYGYWVNAKGWHGPAWIPVMRWDNRIAYLTTGVFVIAMLIVGAELLHAAGVALSTGDAGLLDLADVLRDRYGTWMSTLFMIGFFATSFSSLIGVWHGVSTMVADFVEHQRAERAARALGPQAPAAAPAAPAAEGGRERSAAFRGYMLWLTFPPMLLLFVDRPFALVLAYGVIGALFMPFLAGTLLWLLNSSRTPRQWRNGWLSNTMLTAAGALFLVLCAREVIGLFTG
ncbi:Nramp family divalent metal transporter [Allostreptomyces psammosilenae]|uniref:Nramp family divalent metal transporter n=1 Tax=Allostreptomyces psammosilenae TaxID=1892865 RepID=UPI0015C8991E